MPTARRRHVITETDTVASALNDAAKQWPADAKNRARLLLHLVAAGHRVVLDEQQRIATERREAISRTRGALTGLYGRGYLEELRED